MILQSLKLNFERLLDDQEERNFIKLMKRATNVIVKARTTLVQKLPKQYSMMDSLETL